MKKITNPLTIIGLFAGMAEVAGTIVLPFVSESLQSIFIWYVIGFPVLLVILFFITLNKNPKVLYAPSDFTNEDNFMRLLQTVDKKLNEVSESDPAMKKQIYQIDDAMTTIVSEILISPSDKPSRITINDMDGFDSIDNIHGLHPYLQDANGKKFPLIKDEYIIGRSKVDADIVIDDRTVSRIHCKIEKINLFKDSNKYLIEKISATNRMLINNQDLMTHELNNNDIIKIGRITLKFINKTQTS